MLSCVSPVDHYLLQQKFLDGGGPIFLLYIDNLLSKELSYCLTGSNLIICMQLLFEQYHTCFGGAKKKEAG